MGDAGELLAEAQGEPYECESAPYTLLAEGLESIPNGPALMVMHQPRDHLAELIKDVAPGQDKAHKQEDHLIWTHAQLHHAAIQQALGLQALGVQPCTTLVTLILNGVEWAIMWLAAAVGRMALASLDYGALSAARRPELERDLARLNPSVVVVTTESEAAVVREALPSGAKETTTVVVTSMQSGTGAKTGLKSLIDVAEMAPKDDGDAKARLIAAAKVPDPDRLVLIIFTSGTSSGAPKGCPKTAKGIVHSVKGHQDFWRLRPASRVLIGTANFRAIAPWLVMSVCSSGGACVMPAAAFDPLKMLQAIEKHRVDMVLMIPAQLHMATAHEQFPHFDLSSVKIASVGAEIITDETLIKAARAFPSAGVHVGHGMSEGSAFFTGELYSAPLSIPTIGGIAPLGKVAAGTRVRIFDKEKRCVAPRDVPGELHVGNDSVIRGYLNGEKPEEFYQDEQGRWFNTGDMAIMNRDGLVFILGRYSSSFKRAGISVTPAALEACIGKFVGTQEVCVIGVPHPVLGKEPWAVLKTFGNITEDDIKGRIFDVFGKDNALGGAVTIRQLDRDEFPLNSTHKVDRLKVTKLVEAYLGD